MVALVEARHGGGTDIRLGGFAPGKSCFTRRNVPLVRQESPQVFQSLRPSAFAGRHEHAMSQEALIKSRLVIAAKAGIQLVQSLGHRLSPV